MTERLEQVPEGIPKLNLMLGSEEFESTPFNTTLFTHLGRLAMYDHIFFQSEEQDDEEKVMTGSYLFRQHPSFPKIANFMARNNFPMVLNKVEAADCDVAAFDRMIAQNMGDTDTIPEEWTDGTPES